MQNRGGFLEEPDTLIEARSERDDQAPLSRRGSGKAGLGCARCSRLQPPAAPAAFPASGLPKRRPQSWRAPLLRQHRGSSESPRPQPPPLTLLLLLIVALCALVGVAVCYGLMRLEDDRIGGGGTLCDTAVAKLEFGKVLRQAVERFYEKALPALCGSARQPPAAFLPFAGANDDEECVLPMRGALRTAAPNSNRDAGVAFAVTTQGRLRVSISGFYYVFTQVDAQRLTARTEIVNIMLEVVRSSSESVDTRDLAPSGTRTQDESAPTTDEEQRQSEQSAERQSSDELTLVSVTPRTSENGDQIQTPPIFSARVVHLRAGDELRLRVLCDRSGSGSGHRCDFESFTVTEECGRYHIGAHLIAQLTER